jgi:hypothetical protein
MIAIACGRRAWLINRHRGKYRRIARIWN